MYYRSEMRRQNTDSAPVPCLPVLPIYITWLINAKVTDDVDTESLKGLTHRNADSSTIPSLSLHILCCLLISLLHKSQHTLSSGFCLPCLPVCIKSSSHINQTLLYLLSTNYFLLTAAAKYNDTGRKERLAPYTPRFVKTC